MNLTERQDTEWLDSLQERKKEELRHGDFWRDPILVGDGSSEVIEKSRGNVKWYSTVKMSREYLNNWIAENGKDKIFLDYACGIGKQTIEAAKGGAELAIGIDLSSVSLQHARQMAVMEGVESNTIFIQADCENTGLPDNCIDTLLCSGVLHHFDLKYAFPEMSRILKPGGKCLVLEAWKYNPLIRLYRCLTPRYRTHWESAHIIGFKEIKLASNFFDVENIRYWHFFGLFTVLFRRHSFFHPLLAIANFLDRGFLKYFPFSLLAWQVTFELRKKQ